MAAFYQPAREVGGDFYDFLDLEDGRIGLVVGNATGKGMPAALMMSTTRGMLRAVVQSVEPPGEVLAKVNEALVADIPPQHVRHLLLCHPRPTEGAIALRQRRSQPPLQAT